MTIRERTQQQEDQFLSPFATHSRDTKGRRRAEADDPLRTPFQRDRDRVIHCNAFRRLKHKTQVFLSPEGDHYRTRLTHTLEVSQIARTIAVALQMNEDLTEAIALAHDLGHTPFGHAGERALDDMSHNGFRHYIQSVRVVDQLEKNGAGLNLCEEVLDGILHHTNEPDAATPEGRIVYFSDRIAYINHDIEDAVRAGVLDEHSIPEQLREDLGESKSQRITTLINSVIDNSRNDQICMGEDIMDSFRKLQQFMFEHVYRNRIAKSEEEKVPFLVKTLYEYYSEHVGKLPLQNQLTAEKEGVDQAVIDYIAGMTDHYAVQKFEEIFVPKFWAF